MFNNLLAEMARNKITKQELAVYLGVSEKTIRNYINGSTKISWLDTLRIKNNYFPSLSLEYLFESDAEAKTKEKLKN
ncbi:helix-turn-helix transcriptional regulator [Clostridium pasteurianum]|uniref:helix-turn-helix domain-containing protein n=1 Tax=Clostridium pasteurianum TaxID=1501 RepID=UPI0022608979|nr:helix-turn-helix transcriptional regulator [Clostridium pasteurianum]UZW13234.1 helix-turn-helix transcriptional regulator [Clostridium pasteurianum]